MYVCGVIGGCVVPGAGLGRFLGGFGCDCWEGKCLFGNGVEACFGGGVVDDLLGWLCDVLAFGGGALVLWGCGVNGDFVGCGYWRPYGYVVEVWGV